MARKKSHPNPENPVHITARCPNREPFPLPLPEVWRIMEDFLYLINRQHSIRIHSFLLMPNHFHLVASATKIPFGPAMKDFMFHSSHAMNKLSGKINQRWGNRHFRCELKTYNYFTNTYKYVYQNPVRAGLVRNCEDWPYSTLNGILGKSRLIVPIEDDTILFNETFDWRALQWINTPIESANLATIRTCLKRAEFKLPFDFINNRPHHLEHELL